ncbi:MAG: hypothetical protein ACK47C_04690 [Paracoccaceae bacterium]
MAEGLMRNLLNIVAGLALGLLASCTSEEPCSPELYAKKNADLVAKISDFSTKDPAKRDAVIDGLYAVLDQREAAGADGDLSATCKAIDDLMAELSK